MRQYATFFLGESFLGIDVLMVREVNQNTDITPVDGAQEDVRGLLNLRGLIITVLDPGVRLGMGKRKNTEDTRCIVLKTSYELEKIRLANPSVPDTCSDMVGLLVDKIGDMVSIDENEIEPPPANLGGLDGRFIDGVIKLDKSLLVILKIGELLSMEKETK